MAGGKSDYLESLVVNLLLGAVDPAAWGSPYTPPGTLYLALFTQIPVDDGSGGVEVSGGSYARVAVTNDITTFPTVTNGVKRNGIAITFPTPTADWGTVTSFGIYDASSSGNLWYFGDLNNPLSVPSGKVVRFNPNTLQIVEQ